MQFMSVWKIRPGCTEAAAKRFLDGDAAPPEGVKLLGRWHASDLSCGFSLVEVDDASRAYEMSLTWGDLLEMETHPVIGDEAAGAALVKRYGS